jgi:hypothetical protein
MYLIILACPLPPGEKNDKPSQINSKETNNAHLQICSLIFLSLLFSHEAQNYRIYLELSTQNFNGDIHYSENDVPERSLRQNMPKFTCSVPDQGVLGPFPTGDRDLTGRQPSGTLLP